MTTSIAMEVDTLRDLLERRERVTVVDVRPAHERAEWAIPGSIHVDAYDAIWAGNFQDLDALELDDTSPVVTVCAAGKTSLLAALRMRERGIEAMSLSGGMKGWSLAWNSAEVPIAADHVRIIQIRRTGKGCLSYLIGSDDEAVVIDASVDPEVYIDLAAANGWIIHHVIDTHVHADHLTRSRALAELSGATLALPEQDRVSFPYALLRDGDQIHVGSATLTAMRMPGHTIESTCYLLDDAAVFTGDTLFLDGVGRPDLEASPEEAAQRARLLYASLQRIVAMFPQLMVLPGHTSHPVDFGAPPITAKLAEVAERIPMLREAEEGFVKTILGRIPPTPPNHHLIVGLNEAGLLPDRGGQIDLEAGANRCAVS